VLCWGHDQMILPVSPAQWTKLVYIIRLAACHPIHPSTIALYSLAKMTVNHADVQIGKLLALTSQSL
jgi:hypothetical protein